MTDLSKNYKNFIRNIDDIMKLVKEEWEKNWWELQSLKFTYKIENNFPAEEYSYREVILFKKNNIHYYEIVRVIDWTLVSNDASKILEEIIFKLIDDMKKDWFKEQY